MILITIFLSVVCTLFLGGFSVIAIYRRAWRDHTMQLSIAEISIAYHKQEIEELKKAIQQLIYNYHHSGLNPKIKTMRGALDLGTTDLLIIAEYLKLLGNKEATMLADKLEDNIKWLDVVLHVALKIETENLEHANEFNHLQE